MQQRLIAIALIGLQAYLLEDYSESAAIPILITAAAAFSLIGPLRFRTTRWLRWTLRLVALLACVIRAVVSPIDLAHEWYIPAFIMVPIVEWLLLLQVLTLFSADEREGIHNRFVILCLLGLVASYCRTAYAGERTVLYFGAIAATMLIGFFLQASRIEGTQAGTMKPRRLTFGKVLLIALMGLCMALGSSYAAAQLSRNVEYVQAWLASTISSSIRAKTVGGYERSATLDNITDSQTNGGQQVALTVYCDVEPGYLRGRAFDNFETGYRWRTKSDSDLPPSDRIRITARRLKEDFPDGIQPEGRNQLFALRENNQGPWRSVAVKNVPSRGYIYFAPLGTEYFEGAGRRVIRDQHGVIRGDLDVGKPYISYVSAAATGFPADPSTFPAVLTDVPARYQSFVFASRNICSPGSSDRAKMLAIERYFQDNFSYSVNQKNLPGHGVDRLLYFFEQSKEGHCEFFATAAVFLLRGQGIPARYVTGFAVTELERETGAYWIARNKNAHAWVEAFDRDRGRWVIVEATPDIDVPSGIWSPDAERPNMLAQNLRSQVAGLAEAFSLDYQFDWTWLAGRLSAIGSVLQTPLNIILLISLVGWMGRRTYRNWKDSLYEGTDPRFTTEGAQLRRLSRRLKRHKLVREPTETLHQFVNRMREQAADAPWLDAAADWYLLYAKRRYAVDECSHALPPPPKYRRQQRAAAS